MSDTIKEEKVRQPKPTKTRTTTQRLWRRKKKNTNKKGVKKEEEERKEEGKEEEKKGEKTVMGRKKENERRIRDRCKSAVDGSLKKVNTRKQTCLLINQIHGNRIFHLLFFIFQENLLFEQEIGVVRILCLLFVVDLLPMALQFGRFFIRIKASLCLKRNLVKKKKTEKDSCCCSCSHFLNEKEKKTNQSLLFSQTKRNSGFPSDPTAQSPYPSTFEHYHWGQWRKPWKSCS